MGWSKDRLREGLKWQDSYRYYLPVCLAGSV